MIKKEYHVILSAVISVVFFWMLASVIDYHFSYDKSFWGSLILDKKEVYFRLLFAICFLMFGVFMARVFSKQKRAEKELVKEIAERKRMEEKLYALSVRDELTGLYNRRGFFTLVEQEFKQANRTKTGIMFLYADMDNLKEINDTYGHHEGDKAISEVARILGSTFREADIIARVGGDEFVAVPVGTTGDAVNIISDRINRNIEAFNSERNRGYNLSLSFGIVSYRPNSRTTIDELLSQGDKLMYEQKRQKRERRASLNPHL